MKFQNQPALTQHIGDAIVAHFDGYTLLGNVVSTDDGAGMGSASSYYLNIAATEADDIDDEVTAALSVRVSDHPPGRFVELNIDSSIGTDIYTDGIDYFDEKGLERDFSHIVVEDVELKDFIRAWIENIEDKITEQL